MNFDFTPDPKVLIALTHTPMQPLDALCELIDNSIDSFYAARIQGIQVSSPLIIVELPTKKQLSENAGILRIRDNGPGMTAEIAEKAIRAGFSGNNPYDTLGLFGMGFNISTGKLGNVTTFMTARTDSNKYIKTTINLEKINKTKSYTLEVDEIEKGDDKYSNIDSHGTIIEVSDWWPTGSANNGFVDKLLKYGLATVRKEIGRRYATILRESNLRILINDEKCEPFEHCVWDESRYVVRQSGNIHAKIYIDQVLGSTKRCGNCTAILGSDEISCPSCGSTIIRSIDERVHGWVGIQRYDSETDYGIDLIRNGRAIRKAEKQAFFEYTDDFGNLIKDYPRDQQTGRIIGEIHLDYVPVDFLKQDFQRSSAEWRKAMTFLRGDSSLQPKQVNADNNNSPIFNLYQGYRRVRSFGRGDMYMGYWDSESKKACRISREVEADYYDKFLKRTPGYYDDNEWWKLVENADQPPIEELIECPSCGAQNLKEAECCTVCQALLKGKECVNDECKKLIPISTSSCPYCGANQIPVIIQPWICEVCRTKNIATENICTECHMPRGTKDPLSKEMLIASSDKVDTLSDNGLIIGLADGSSNNPLVLDVYSTHKPIITPIKRTELPLLIFKDIGHITIFVNKAHPIFTKCNIKAEQIIASEVAMTLYDERRTLANYVEHNLTNLTWSVINKNWIDRLELNSELVYIKSCETLDNIRGRISQKLGTEAEFYFEDLSTEQKKAMTEEMIKKGIDLSIIGELKKNGGYILYAPYDFLLHLYSHCMDAFFNGNVWDISLTVEETGLIDSEIVEHVNKKIKTQYQNSLEDVVCYARDRYEDSLILRRVESSIEFLQKKLVE